MSLGTSKIRDLAERLIAYESRGKKSSRTGTLAAFPVCERLGPVLSTLMGETGFRMVLSRAVVRAQAEVPSLSIVQVQADGSLSGLDKLDKADGNGLPQPDLANGSVVVVAELLGLLVAFIGEAVTLQIVAEVWPKLSTQPFGLSVRR